MTGVSMGFLKIFQYLYCYMVVFDLIKHEYTGIDAPIFK